jgi:lipoprotein-anchoring transpeptidase ErfK/SrfK
MGTTVAAGNKGLRISSGSEGHEKTPPPGVGDGALGGVRSSTGGLGGGPARAQEARAAHLGQTEYQNAIHTHRS